MGERHMSSHHSFSSLSSDQIMDPAIPHALRLQAVLVGGLVVIHAKQTVYILEDAEAAFRKLLDLATAGGEGGGAAASSLLPEGAAGGGGAITIPASALGGDMGDALAALGLGGLALPGAPGASQLFGGLSLTQGGGRASAGLGGSGRFSFPGGGAGGGGPDEDMFLMPATATDALPGGGGVAGVLGDVAGGDTLAAAARGEFGGALGGGGLAFDGYLGGDGLMEAPPGAGDMEGLMMMGDGGEVAGGLGGGEWGLEGEQQAAAAEGVAENAAAHPAPPPHSSTILTTAKRTIPRLDLGGAALPNATIRAWIGDPTPILVGGVGGRAGRTILGAVGGGFGAAPAHTAGKASAAAALAAGPIPVPAAEAGAWPPELDALLKGAMRWEGGALPQPAKAAAKRRKTAAAGGAVAGGGMVGPDGVVDWGEVGPPHAAADEWAVGGAMDGVGAWGEVDGTRFMPHRAPAGATDSGGPGGYERLRVALLGEELAGPLAAATAAGRGSPGSSGRLGGGGGGGGGQAASGDRPPSDGDGPPRPARSSGEAAAAAAAAALAEDDADLFLPAVPEEDGGEGGGGGGTPQARGAAFLEAGGGEALPPGAAGDAATAGARRAAAVNPATRAVISFLRARFAAQVAVGDTPAASLGGAAAALGSRAEAARLFYQACVCVTAGYLRADQPDVGGWGDITLLPGPALRGVGGAALAAALA